MLIVIFHFYSVAAMKNFFQVIKLIYNIRFRNPRISFTFLLTCKYCQYNTAKANVFHSTHSPSPKKKKKKTKEIKPEFLLPLFLLLMRSLAISEMGRVAYSVLVDGEIIS